ncbi:MAG: XTP/dITP diphosphohydrolase [Solirubrobacteraceae bacterium]|nr:XTP/dITP diphosphohydrolase [Solirubrobacteraceae bacterium]
MKLVLATRNAHKTREFATLLAPHEILPLPDDVTLPPETGETFLDNARDKALAAAGATGLRAIADDSGIESAALGGAPGVRSARFAGERATDEENLAKLLREAPAGSPLAYVCALVLAEPSAGADAHAGAAGGADAGGADAGGRTGADACAGAAGRAGAGGAEAVILHAVEGRCTGTLAATPRGDGGFGYDPAFEPDDIPDGRTMAELEPHEKDAISHRGRAARELLALLDGA